MSRTGPRPSTERLLGCGGVSDLARERPCDDDFVGETAFFRDVPAHAVDQPVLRAPAEGESPQAAVGHSQLKLERRAVEPLQVRVTDQLLDGLAEHFPVRGVRPLNPAVRGGDREQIRRMVGEARCCTLDALVPWVLGDQHAHWSALVERSVGHRALFQCSSAARSPY